MGGRGVNNFMNRSDMYDSRRSYNNDYSLDNQNQTNDYERYKMQRTFL